MIHDTLYPRIHFACRTFTAVAALAAIPASPAIGYAPQSSLMDNPESALGYLVESTDFWKPAFDASQGAFFSEVGRNGQPTSSDKAFLSQSRNAYAFSKAFMITGDAAYLDYADRALRFMYQYGWDATRDGWWGMANSNGSINTGIWYNSTRWSFWQHYMLLGISAYVEATNDPFHRSWLERGNSVNDQKLWDSRDGFEGYYNRTSLDWVPQNDKGFTPTVDAITTTALTNYLMTRSAFRKERLLQLANNITDRMMNPVNGHVVSFPSAFNNNWQVKAATSTTSIGHHIKTAWCLARAYLIEPDPKYRDAGAELLGQIWYHRDQSGNAPWDHENGIMLGNLNVFTGEVTGNADWWTVEQGFTGGIMNWYIGRQPEFLEMADRSLAHFTDFLYDEQFGEVFSRTNPQGVVTDAKKGDMFKAAYHSVELFFLAYLYGNLYLHNRPVTLHYAFPQLTDAQSITLWPLAIEDERLHITDVELDGQPYPHYEGTTRTLGIPANTGGIFKVTFASRYAFNPPAHHAAGWIDDWMGYVYLSAAEHPWTYHPAMGWIAAIARTRDGGSWFYHHAGQFFFFSSPETYPYFYQYGSGWEYVR